MLENLESFELYIAILCSCTFCFPELSRPKERMEKNKKMTRPEAEA